MISCRSCQIQIVEIVFKRFRPMNTACQLSEHVNILRHLYISVSFIQFVEEEALLILSYNVVQRFRPIATSLSICPNISAGVKNYLENTLVALIKRNIIRSWVSTYIVTYCFVCFYLFIIMYLKECITYTLTITMKTLTYICHHMRSCSKLQLILRLFVEINSVIRCA